MRMRRITSSLISARLAASTPRCWASWRALSICDPNRRISTTTAK